MVSVREKPPLRLHVDATAPEGTHRRWSWDEPSAANVHSDLRFSDSMPGGFDSMSATLPRRAGVDYSDLERLSTLRVLGVGGEVAGEYRLEATPRVSGDEFSVSPEAVGWQAHLADDETAAEVYVDRDLGNWQGVSRTRRIALIATNTRTVNEGVVDADQGSGLPCISLQVAGNGSAIDQTCESWYDAGPGARIGSVYYDYATDSTTATTEPAATWTLRIVNYADDDAATNQQLTADLHTIAESSGSGTSTPTTPQRACWIEWYTPAGSGGTNGVDFSATVRRLTVFGSHGLTKRGTAPDQGYYASDVIANAVSRWAPLLNYSTGPDGTVKPSSFTIPHLSFREHTTASEIVQQANRFHLNDWAVWENRTFHYHPRGERGRNWRARIGPTQLAETGPQVERLWNGVIVFFQDVDGASRSIGPTSSTADTTSTLLTDTDPENPANQLGIHRWVKLDMGVVSTPAGAQEVGRRFLEESRQLDGSGQANLVGYVEDDKGVTRPAWQVHSGDTITFVDAADKSARRIVRKEYSDATKTATIDIDAPPQGLDALLERLGVVLVSLGF